MHSEGTSQERDLPQNHCVDMETSTLKEQIFFFKYRANYLRSFLFTGHFFERRGREKRKEEGKGKNKLCMERR